MKILSVNAGSSSLKFTLFEMPEGIELIGGYFEKIGLNDSFYSIKFFYNSNNQLFNVSGNCPICFCLSGSRNQRVANLFSEMFLEYQYDKDKKFVKSR